VFENAEPPDIGSGTKQLPRKGKSIMTKTDVIIIGAGPYGLSTAAHLRTIKGLEFRIFGKPMSFWDEKMPEGMYLRSNWTATQIASPDSALSLESFIAEKGNPFTLPVPIDRFVQYGLWYQKQAVKDLEQQDVTRVESDQGGFRVSLRNGETVNSRRVVVAAGIGMFARRPSEFDELPTELATHTSEHRNFQRFAARKVLIIGGGQSALESAALLHEAGAEVEVAARTKIIHWLQGWTSKTLHHGMGKTIRRILYAPTDVGPAGLSQLCARPDLYNKMPRSLQDRLRKRAVRPAGARWLVDRLKDVPIRLGRSVESVSVAGEKVKVRFDDGSERIVDHVMLGTGYRIDVTKYSFLAPELIQSISRSNGFPKLRAGLETSIPGLHILGAPGVWSFGPVMQFVSGTTYASRTLTRHLANNRKSP
jgi:cation diffusion facilitator CzcD-associated flavoprotein CzcO